MTVSVLILAAFFKISGGDFIDRQPYSSTYSLFAPSTVNFQDIYTNNLSEDASSPTDDITSHNAPTQFVEFHPSVLRISRITPPPKLLLNSSYIKKNTTEAPSTTPPPFEELEEPLKIIPVVRNQPRGILDVLFPSARVKTFKHVFDGLKRVLSYTFKK